MPRRLRAEAVPLSVPFGAQVMDNISTLPKEFASALKDYPHSPALAGATGSNFFLLPTDWGGISGGVVRGEGLTPCTDELRRKGGGLGVALQVGNAGNLNGRGLLGRGVGQPMRSVLRLRTCTHIHNPPDLGFSSVFCILCRHFSRQTDVKRPKPGSARPPGARGLPCKPMTVLI